LRKNVFASNIKRVSNVLSTKGAVLAAFTLNHSLPKEKQPKFSTKNPSLQISIVNYTLAAVTILRSEHLFPTHDKILLFIIVLSENKSSVAYNSRYFLENFPPKAATLVEIFQKGSWESKRHQKIDSLGNYTYVSVAFREAKIVLKRFLYNFLVRNSCDSGFWRETHLTPPYFHKTSSCPTTSVSEFPIILCRKKGRKLQIFVQKPGFEENSQKVAFFRFF
jgi:hypothetical protein